jgi:hypothetical protein
VRVPGGGAEGAEADLNPKFQAPNPNGLFGFGAWNLGFRAGFTLS